jgi:predicted homoserine dehydrogenase-like protein
MRWADGPSASWRSGQRHVHAKSGRAGNVTVRIGMIGAARMSYTHANCLAKIPKAKIVAVVDVMLDRAQNLAVWIIS